jgi:hypothetical protein
MKFNPIECKIDIPNEKNFSSTLSAALWSIGVRIVDAIQLGDYDVTGDGEVTSLSALAFAPDDKVIKCEFMYFAVEEFWSAISAADFLTGEYYFGDGTAA